MLFYYCALTLCMVASLISLIIAILKRGARLFGLPLVNLLLKPQSMLHKNKGAHFFGVQAVAPREVKLGAPAASCHGRGLLLTYGPFISGICKWYQWGFRIGRITVRDPAGSAGSGGR